jgi:hypothetical protein
MAKVSGLAVSTVERFLLSPPIAPYAHRLAARGRFRARGQASEAERPPEAMRFATAILAIRRTVGWISQWK